ncbi:MAG: glycosyltransferase family 4 protein, partial [Lachnospiraceae bacterium]|nr:glycosyltransferase family 4 protein [Lachnospiraceae bacterium]
MILSTGFQAGCNMRFVTIGYIEWRKGQDLLIDAVSMLPDELMRSAEFILIGQNTSLLAQRLADRISMLPNVIMRGTIPRDEVHDLLDNADVLICPSREDPMPTVCAEAMMHGVPCIVSDVTGTSEYIKDGFDGIVFRSENAEDLKDRIVWCMDHPEDIIEMGRRSREIYRRVFSEEAFEQNLLKNVKEMIG